MMEKRSRSATCLALFLLLLPPVSAGEHHASRLLVHGAPSEILSRLPEITSARIRWNFASTGWSVLEWRNGPEAEALKKILADRGVTSPVELDWVIHSRAVPGDPGFQDGSQWALHNTGQNGGTADVDIDAPEGWDLETDASQVIVAVVDSGIRYTHEDLAENLWRNPGEIPGNGIDDDGDGFVDDVFGIDTLNETGNPRDDFGHGTHVAGIVGARGNNGKGIAGVAWKVRIMGLRFEDAQGNGFVSDAIECLEYARRKGAHIVNLSWGLSEYSQAFFDEMASLRAAGIPVVCAAGNEGKDIDTHPDYPSSFDLDNIVSVGAIARFDYLDGYSNYGAKSVDLAAPGTDILSTWGDSDSSYLRLSGTSMAAPHVAGILALEKSRFPNLGAAPLIARLLAGAEPMPALAGKCLTGGRANLFGALRSPIEFLVNPFTAPLGTEFHFQALETSGWAGALWEFGDGFEAKGFSAVHQYQAPGEYDVTLHVSDARGGTVEAAHRLTVLSVYAVREDRFVWRAAGTGSVPPVPRDDGTVVLDLPFPFQFYGRPVTRLFASPHGYFSFMDAGLNAQAPQSLPDTSLPNAGIFPFGSSELSSNQIVVSMDGSAPNRSWILTTTGICFSGSGAVSPIQFQLILEESRNELLFQYQWVPSNTVAVAGVEDFTGISGTALPSASAIQPQKAWRFVPWENLPARPAELRMLGTPGGSAVRLMGDPGKAYRLESSGDFSHWKTEGEIDLPARGYVDVTVDSSVGLRYFRAVGIP